MDELIHWSAPPKTLRLLDGNIHVWRAGLDLDIEQKAELQATLASGEIERANAFVFESDRSRFAAARGTLRFLLSKYLGCAASEIQILANEFGKPFVDGDISFNLSHSDGLAVYAFARNLGVGIDLERIRSDIEYVEIAERHFAENEVKEVRAAPEERKIEVFFRSWTRKEAFAKATGRGLAADPGIQHILEAPGAEVLANASGVRWVAKSFIPQEKFVGCVASSAQSAEYAWWEFSI